MARVPVPWFDGQVIIEEQIDQDPEVWAPNELKVDEDGDPVREALFSNHNAKLLLECDGNSLMGRVLQDPERGVAHKIETLKPLRLEMSGDGRRLLSFGGLSFDAVAPPLGFATSTARTVDPVTTLQISYDTATLAVVAGKLTVVGGTGGGGGIPEAPSNNAAYGRRNTAWTPVLMITGDILDGGNF